MTLRPFKPALVVPHRAADPHREALWVWCGARWAAHFGGMFAAVGTDDGGANPGEFNHPLAINRAARLAIDEGATVLAVVDTDCTFSDPRWVRQAMLEVHSGQHPWVLPARYVKLAQWPTTTLIGGEPTVDLAGTETVAETWETEWVGEGVSWSGIVIVPVEGFERAGGYDERYRWWGADDVAFGLTMDTLWGAHHRAPGAVVHLWHPAPVEETYGSPAHAQQQALTDRYRAAAGNQHAMRQVRFGR